MSTPRVSRAILRASKRTLHSSPRPVQSFCAARTTFALACTERRVVLGLTPQWRAFSNDTKDVPKSNEKEPQNQEQLPKQYTFEEIQTLASSPHPKIHIIDVRQPAELESTGRIPTAINIPITTNPDAFFISEEEFEDRFGWERPPLDEEVVFYCKAGVRSRTATEFARQAGYENVGDYSGSWLDWERKGGEVEK